MAVHLPFSEDELSKKIRVWLLILSNSNLLAQHPDIEGNSFVVLNTILQMTCDIFAPIDVLLSMKSLEAKEQHVFFQYADGIYKLPCTSYIEHTFYGEQFCIESGFNSMALNKVFCDLKHKICKTNQNFSNRLKLAIHCFELTDISSIQSNVLSLFGYSIEQINYLMPTNRKLTNKDSVMPLSQTEVDHAYGLYLKTLLQYSLY